MSPNIDLAPLRALIVDDDAIFRRRLGRGLSEYGVDAVHFGSVEEGLVAMAAKVPDVLVVNPILRGGSALQLIEALKSIGNDCSTAIIALLEGAGGPPPLVAEGCDAFLVKPCSVEQVLERIDQLFHTKTVFVTAAS